MKKRKVSNLLALAVLSTVYQRPMHRYEMASIMRARGKDQDMQIKWGSLYTVVDNLEKHGLLQTIGNSRQGARPERTVYEITDAGRRELIDWTRELISSPLTEHPRFAAGLSVMVALPPGEVVELLQFRLSCLDQEKSALRSSIDEQATLIPQIFLIENEYSLAMISAEAEWVRALLGKLESGTYPDFEIWQTWHRSGTMPPELIELSERGAIEG